MSKLNKYPLYEITSLQFEQLCFDLLTRSYQWVNFEAYGIESGPYKNVDFCGTKDEAEKKINVAVEVKHIVAINPHRLGQSLIKSASYFHKFNELILISSAPLSQNEKDIIYSDIKKTGINLTLICQNDIFELLDKNNDIAEKYFKEIRKIVTKRNYAKILGLTGSVISIIGLIFSLYSINGPKKETSLNNQINSLEQSLIGVKNLEKSLTSFKNELQETSISESTPEF